MFFCTLRPQNETPLKKMEKEIERRQIKPDLEITHQGQCAHQVSLNLADPDFPGLTRFLSQGLLNDSIMRCVPVCCFSYVEE